MPLAPPHQSRVRRLVGGLLNLVRSTWRLLLLLSMFAPVMATGQLAMVHGYHRAQWLSLLRSEPGTPRTP